MERRDLWSGDDLARLNSLVYQGDSIGPHVFVGHFCFRRQLV